LKSNGLNGDINIGSVRERVEFIGGEVSGICGICDLIIDDTIGFDCMKVCEGILDELVGGFAE
jgi:hypothetical protein